MRKYIAFIGLLFMYLQSSFAQQSSAPGNDVVWHDARSLSIKGKGWDETERPFDRLPLAAKKEVTPAVWKLSKHSAGVHILFRSNSTRIKVRWSVLFDNQNNHMPATAVKGLDLYVKTTDGWRWAAAAIPRQKSNEVDLISKMTPQEKEFMLYLPLYDGVDSLFIGVEKDAEIKTSSSNDSDKPIFIYGTSITQGASASRPGMAYPSITGRALNREIINLGFSGNGKMDAGMAKLLANREAEMFVIDCLPNMAVDAILARSKDLVNQIRMQSPQVPILLVENIPYTHAWLNKSLMELQTNKNVQLKQAFNELRAAGVKNLFYLDNQNLMRDGGDGAVDGVHLTDLGAQHFAKVLTEKILDINKQIKLKK